MRLMIAGGGGFRVPLIYRALSEGAFSGLVHQVVLYDIDAERAAAMETVLRDMPVTEGAQPPAVVVASTLAEALKGTDVVFAAVRPGGTAGRIFDERVALDLGLLGQETIGAGGISFALRSIPAMLDLARSMIEQCPNAWLINFTNPAGMVTEALVPVLGRKVVGICDSASGLVARAARTAGSPLAPGHLEGAGYYGLNHLGWLYRLAPHGTDLLPGLLADAELLHSIEEGRLFGQAQLERLKCLPNEYLFYYYQTDRATSAILSADQTRGESVHRQQAALYARLAAPGTAGADGDALRQWEAARRVREEGYLAESRNVGEQRREEELAGGGYERVAMAVMRAVTGDGDAELIVNTPNKLASPTPDGQEVAIPGLPADAVVEVPSRVGTDGAWPLPQERPAGPQLTLMRHVKDVERLTIKAVVDGDRNAALQAFAGHPLVGSEELARKLLDGYESAFPGLQELWAGGRD
ncbi:6-phospho-beta-glucosidase [Arthrobacter sp. M4]|uniref:family 4 glycosyl hydrolase n=1 Tax=Arthrobacter sp. M4 TaxID=218160 RepID=UPI001CDBA04D|nr:6-phospho-beta-glucosidase [Arthrobacter sp. M4]MCA4132451.1 6-phospho-beta-glucosidase [Arthrobacter sp. M4]